MTQSEKRIYLINKLLDEQPHYRDVPVPKSETEQKRLLRTLMNIRRPNPIGEDFLKVQDEYLLAEIMEKGITDLSDLIPISDDSRIKVIFNVFKDTDYEIYRELLG